MSFGFVVVVTGFKSVVVSGSESKSGFHVKAAGGDTLSFGVVSVAALILVSVTLGSTTFGNGCETST